MRSSRFRALSSSSTSPRAAREASRLDGAFVGEAEVRDPGVDVDGEVAVGGLGRDAILVEPPAGDRELPRRGLEVAAAGHHVGGLEEEGGRLAPALALAQPHRGVGAHVGALAAVHVEQRLDDRAAQALVAGIGGRRTDQLDAEDVVLEPVGAAALAPEHAADDRLLDHEVDRLEIQPERGADQVQGARAAPRAEERDRMEDGGGLADGAEQPGRPVAEHVGRGAGVEQRGDATRRDQPVGRRREEAAVEPVADQLDQHQRRRLDRLGQLARERARQGRRRAEEGGAGAHVEALERDARGTAGGEERGRARRRGGAGRGRRCRRSPTGRRPATGRGASPRRRRGGRSPRWPPRCGDRPRRRRSRSRASRRGRRSPPRSWSPARRATPPSRGRPRPARASPGRTAGSPGRAGPGPGCCPRSRSGRRAPRAGRCARTRRGPTRRGGSCRRPPRPRGSRRARPRGASTRASRGEGRRSRVSAPRGSGAGRG